MDPVTLDDDVSVTKVFVFLTKKEGLDTQAFRDYYEHTHVPLVLSLAPAPTVYQRHYVVPDSGMDFDVVTEIVLPDDDAFNAWMALAAVPEVVADEERFLDRSRTRACLIEDVVD